MKLYHFTLIGVLVLLTGCGNNSSGPSPVSGIYGWAVGDTDGSIPTILHSTDGIEWTRQTTDLVIPNCNLSSVSVVDSSTVWASGGFSEGFGIVLKTINGGETWLRMGSEIDLPNATLTVNAFSADVAWVGSEGAVYFTTDGGVSWADMAQSTLPDMNWQGTCCLSSSNVWISGGMNGQGSIYHTSDGGALWTAHAESLTADWPVLSVKAYDQNNVWAVGHGFFISKSINGGIDWEIVTPDSMFGSGNDANEITIMSSNDVWVALDYGNIWKTSDGGANWDIQTVPDGVQGYFMLGIYASDVNTAWSVGGSGFGTPSGVIIGTTNGGTTWTRLDDGSLPILWDIDFAE